MQKAAEEAQKNERIANGTNRSTFLHLGEKKTNWYQRAKAHCFKDKN
jgi:hypothetical protein